MSVQKSATRQYVTMAIAGLDDASNELAKGARAGNARDSYQKAESIIRQSVLPGIVNAARYFETVGQEKEARYFRGVGKNVMRVVHRMRRAPTTPEPGKRAAELRKLRGELAELLRITGLKYTV